MKIPYLEGPSLCCDRATNIDFLKYDDNKTTGTLFDTFYECNVFPVITKVSFCNKHHGNITRLYTHQNKFSNTSPCCITSNKHLLEW